MPNIIRADPSPPSPQAAAPARSWRDVLKVHPACELFPLEPPDKLRAMGEDIKKNGLTAPIVFYHWQKDHEPELIDGRNRLAALEAIGVQVIDANGRLIYGLHGLRWEEVRGQDGVDPYAYVVSANIHRRHLTDDDKKRLIAELIKANPKKSDRQIAKAVRASPTTAGKVRKELEAKGDVSTVDTRTDTKGRRQSAHKRKPPPLTPLQRILKKINAAGGCTQDLIDDATIEELQAILDHPGALMEWRELALDRLERSTKHNAGRRPTPMPPAVVKAAARKERADKTKQDRAEREQRFEQFSKLHEAMEAEGIERGSAEWTARERAALYAEQEAQAAPEPLTSKASEEPKAEAEPPTTVGTAEGLRAFTKRVIAIRTECNDTRTWASAQLSKQQKKLLGDAIQKITSGLMAVIEIAEQVEQQNKASTT